MQTVTLIDYGSGNLRSAQKALIAAAAGLGPGFEVNVSDEPEIIARADRLVLPGVGAFAACMRALQERSGVIEAMTEAVKARGVPFLGVCVGMQLLADRGLEFGHTLCDIPMHRKQFIVGVNGFRRQPLSISLCYYRTMVCFIYRKYCFVFFIAV
jgi:imidazoleglycerol phosphate synthase glutamine amidotransferase subunit HisH